MKTLLASVLLLTVTGCATTTPYQPASYTPTAEDWERKCESGYLSLEDGTDLLYPLIVKCNANPEGNNPACEQIAIMLPPTTRLMGAMRSCMIMGFMPSERLNNKIQRNISILKQLEKKL